MWHNFSVGYDAWWQLVVRSPTFWAIWFVLVGLGLVAWISSRRDAYKKQEALRSGLSYAEHDLTRLSSDTKMRFQQLEAAQEALRREIRAEVEQVLIEALQKVPCAENGYRQIAEHGRVTCEACKRRTIEDMLLALQASGPVPQTKADFNKLVLQRWREKVPR